VPTDGSYANRHASLHTKTWTIVSVFFTCVK
jgi:hypothetical protein